MSDHEHPRQIKSKKYRRSQKEVIGVKQIHHGIYDDPKDCEMLVHGVPTKASEHVDDCFAFKNASGIKNFLHNFREEKYVRNIREPLGKGIKRNYAFPDVVGDDEFRFGVKSTVKNYNAKDLMFSSRLSEDEKTKMMYQKTHGHTDPGEQKDRNYKWPVDKHAHYFGIVQPIEIDGAKKSLVHDLEGGNFAKTKIVNKHLEDFRQATVEGLGKPHCHGSLHQKLPEDFCFGVKSMKDTNWNAGMCLFGDPSARSVKDLQPDPDLGKSHLCRSKLKAVTLNTNTRVSGLPSIRIDLPKKQFNSVANIVNYGDESDVYELLFPNHHTHKGLTNEHLTTPIPKEELKVMMKNKGYEIEESEFETIFSLCVGKTQNQENKVTFNDFIAVVRNLKREYLKYKPFFK